MSLGDISAQKLVEKADTIDFKRTLRFTIIGSCIVVSIAFHCCKAVLAIRFYVWTTSALDPPLSVMHFITGSHGPDMVYNTRKGFWPSDNFSENCAKSGSGSGRFHACFAINHFDISGLSTRFGLCTNQGQMEERNCNRCHYRMESKTTKNCMHLHYSSPIISCVFLFFQIFPWIQMINFYYVPFLLRPLIINIVALFWYTFLAWYANKLKYKA